MNSIHEPQLAWLFWSLILILIWAVIYALLKSKESKKEMLLVSLWTALFGLTEPFFVPAYWNPPSLFDLAHRTGFDIESFIFSFGIGGIAVVVYEYINRVSHERMETHERHLSRHRYHLLSILSSPLIFLALFFTASLNPIYSAIIAMTIGGFAAWYCRPDLKKKMISSAFVFLGIYFVYFITLIALYPGYVEQVWNLKAISGILISGIPLEELLFAFSFGFIWSSIYEHFTWRKIKNL
ncbi:MAG: lycopene cyclase domain-containing protein [Patescibacteria group bacterium]